MKQALLSVIMMMAAITANAELQYKLVRYYDDAGQELVEFIYNENHQMKAAHTVMNGLDWYECYDSIRYDANGDMVKLETWQLFYDDNDYHPYYKKVNYVDYTYDAQHRLTSRKNYNIDMSDNKFYLGGEYTFTYNENNQMTSSVLYFMSRVFNKDTFIYENGLLTERISMGDYEGTGLVPDMKYTFEYDARGALLNKYDSLYDGSSYSLYKRHQSQYDNNGNCEWHKTFDNSGNEVQRQVYTYESKLLAETLMPSTPEMVMNDSRPQNTAYNVNTYTNEEYWTLDVDWVLQHACDYTYEYVGINESDVEDVNDDVIREAQKVTKVMIDGRLYIECGEKMYDMNGRRVK